MPFWSTSGFHQIWINKTLLQPIFVLRWILYVFHYFILNAPCLIIRSIFLIFAIYRSKVWRIKSVLRIHIFPLNLLSCVQKTLKNIKTKFHWDRMKHKHFIEVSNICPTITLIISETKLDDSFNDNLFVINGYKFERKDRNAKGSGLFVYYRSDLPIRRLKTLEREQSESIILELRLKNRTWGISCNYRPPSTNDNLFELDFSSKLDQVFIKYDHVCVVGDLNYNMLVSEKKAWSWKTSVILLISQILSKRKHVLPKTTHPH